MPEGSIEALVAQGEKLGALEAMDQTRTSAPSNTSYFSASKGSQPMRTTQGSWVRRTTASTSSCEEALAAIDRTDIPLGRLGRARHEDRGDEHPGHGAPRRREYGDLWPPQAHKRAPWGEKRQGDSDFRPRPEGPRGIAETDRREGDLYLYPWGDASHPRLSGTEEISSFLRPLRHGMAKSAKGVRRVSRGNPHDDELPHEGAFGLQGQYFHHGHRRLARHAPHHQPQLLPGDNEGPCNARLLRGPERKIA